MKKGVFYLFVAVILASATLAMYFAATAQPFDTPKDAVEARVSTLNEFVNAVDRDIGKASYIAAFRALIAMEETVTTRGSYFNDSEQVFTEAFFNGTIDGENLTILNASSISDYIARVNQSVNGVGARINLTIETVELYHNDPWHISVTVQYRNIVRDKDSLARWEYTDTTTQELPVRSLRDPVYGVETGGRFTSTVRQTNVTRFINDTDDANDTSELMRHTNSSLYVATEDAPSYLMRFEGNFSESMFGIESLVDLAALEAQGVSLNTSRSIVDHNYFGPNGSAVTVCDQVINTPSWFRIDKNHLTRYELDPKLDPDGYEC